ncbi:hypothetical protein SLA2020_222250 [Shorea laevis]
MGQWQSSAGNQKNEFSETRRRQQAAEFFGAVQVGNVKVAKAALEREPGLLYETTGCHSSALHIAAGNGQVEILSMLLERHLNPDVVNRYKQTPLLFAAIYGRVSCLKKLIDLRVNIAMCDTLQGRNCLHYAAYYGRSDCLRVILSAAKTCPFVNSRHGCSVFVNKADYVGETPLHIAARRRWPECVRILLDNGALVSASTGVYGLPGDTPLHLAAREGSLDCVGQLLAWGADRFQRDASGRTPYEVALKHYHNACAALLNPSSAQPLVWPALLKLTCRELNEDVKALLKQVLMEANREREKIILKGFGCSLPSASHSDGSKIDDTIYEAISDADVCCICFDKVCTIQVQDCGHQMCAQCTLALCCHNKPNSTIASITHPTCPFCRGTIAQLVMAPKLKDDHGAENNTVGIRSSKPRNPSQAKQQL